MSHEIEADFVDDWDNEETSCQNCTSFTTEEGKNYCNEAKSKVPANGHCDFFQSVD